MSNRANSISSLTSLFGSEGESVFINTVKCPWRYSKNAALTVDHITVENAADGYQWVRVDYQHPDWLNRNTWHIDFDNGNDENDGYTQPTALLTLVELQRRIKGIQLRNFDVNIFTYGDNKITDPLNTQDWRVFTPSPSVVIRRLRFIANAPTGALGIYSTGTITAVNQVRDRPTNKFYQMTFTKAGPTPETFVNPNLNPFGSPFTPGTFNAIKIVGGPRDGARAWTAAGNDTISGGLITTSEWLICDQINLAVTSVVPQVNDVYQLQQFPKLYIDHFDIDGNDDNYGSGIYFQGYAIYPTHGFDSQSPGQLKATSRGGCIVCTDCYFMTSLEVFNFGQAFTYWQNCATLDAFQIAAGSWANNFVDGGLFHLALSAIGGGSGLQISADAMIITGALIAADDAVIFSGTCGIKAGSGHAQHGGVIAARDGKIMTNQDFYGNQGLYGIGNASAGGTYPVGIAVSSGGKFYHNGTDLNLVTIKGTDGYDFSIDNSFQSHPMDTTTGLPKALQNNTYTNLQNVGVFNGIAVLPEKGSGAAILKLENYQG